MFCAKWEELKEYHPYLGMVVSEFMKENDVEQILTGRYELADGCYVNVDEYDTRENYAFEAHKKYVDVQLMIKGKEEIFCAPLSCGKESISYNEEKDVTFYTCEADEWYRVALTDGGAVVLYPEDLHAPCNSREKRHNRKLVFKIPCNNVEKKL